MVFSKKLEEIKNTVLSEDIKVVSFDVFDTLVVRPCAQPTDLFKIVGKRCGYEGDFVEIRKMAEQYARKNKLHCYDDINIYEIYDEFIKIAGITKEYAEEILNCELAVEYDYIMPRKSICELYKIAKENGKKVIIASDMYLPKEFIQKVLEKNRIVGYDKLYVSSEERLAKGSGRLFEKIIAEYSAEGVEKESIIHLGDNTRADVEMPKKLGMKSIHLPNAIGILNSKDTFKDLVEHCKRTDSTFLVGCLANYLFDDPFYPFNRESFSTGNARLMGAVLYGPLLLSYTKWLIEDTIKSDVDKILFVMRDGYIIDKIYSILSNVYSKAPDVDDIYLSRTIRYVFNGKHNNGLLESFTQFPIPEAMTVGEFMTKRLLVKESEREEVLKIFKSVGYANEESRMGKPIQYYSIMLELQKIFASNTKSKIEVIEDYCKNKIVNSKKYAVVDVGYRGSVSRFLKDELNINNIGYQMLETPLSNQYSRGNYDIRSFISYSFNLVKELKILHPLTEDIISIQEGTACDIERTGDAFEIIKKENISVNPILDEMQEGVMEYVEYAYEALKKDIVTMSFDEDLSFDLLTEFLRNPGELDKKVIEKLSFEESDFIKIGNGNNIYEAWLEAKKKYIVPHKEPMEVKENINKPVQEIEPIQEEWQKISKPHLWAIKVCEKLHLLNFAIKAKRVIKKKSIQKEKNIKLIQELFENPINNSTEKISSSEFKNRINDNLVLLAGHMTSFDKGTCNFVNNLSNVMTENKMVLMSECIHLNEERTRQKINFPFFIVPSFLGKDCYPTNTGIICDKKIRKYVNRKSYLKWGVDNLHKRHIDMELDYAYYFVYYAEMYINKMLDILKLKYAILWNEFFAFHHILKNICLERNIKIVYLEFGSLPGTISIEHLGQMGASFPGRFAEEFKKFDVSKEELIKGKEVLDFLKESGLNRNIQPLNNNIEEIKNKLKKGRPTILYAGVNDYESGLVPYTEETRISHCQSFKSSEDALVLLAEYAIKNDWNLIYKPHPIIEKQSNSDKNYDDNVIMALNVDINAVIDIADVVVTILSQVSYTALIREKAVVMLGYTQLKGKDCCYEGFLREELEAVLKTAIEHGYTGEQKKAFIKHITQMNKYNLFNDLQSKPIEYGKTIEQAVEYIFECDDTLEWYRNC